jgi:hypothetical protein
MVSAAPMDRHPPGSASGLRLPLMTWRAAVPCSRWRRQVVEMVPPIVDTGLGGGARIAFIGAGPRGISVLERIGARLRSPADMPLARITKGNSVGIIGLGLSFYDVLSALTIGRGGKFVRSSSGFTYIRSGSEPALIVAGSRSGLPIPVRGVAQKSASYRYKPRFFTNEFVHRSRAAGPRSLRDDVLPWINADAVRCRVPRNLRAKRPLPAGNR